MSSRDFDTGTSRLDIPASTIFNINTDVNFLVVVYPFVLAATKEILIFGTGGRGYGIAMQDTSGHVDFTKVGANVTTVTLALTANVWHAVYAHSGTGVDGTFKLLRLDNQSLTTETVTDSAGITVPSNDPGVIGNWIAPASGFRFPGRIDSAFMWQGSVISDNEFRGLVYGGWPNKTLLFGTKILGNSPETDWSGNANNPTVTETTLADGAPLGPLFGFDLPMPLVTAAAPSGRIMSSLVGAGGLAGGGGIAGKGGGLIA